jgi:hypothetical protein
MKGIRRRIDAQIGRARRRSAIRSIRPSRTPETAAPGFPIHAKIHFSFLFLQ